ncbi:MAG: hypothetical protein LBQ38_12630 [Spirochaetaceae bacterium]|nr:hypothetical protein [Spirochaetaceae bacterium]
MTEAAGREQPPLPCRETNIRLLREKYPGLAERLLRDGGPEAPAAALTVRVETAASGDPTLLVNGLHIHSPRDPVREARRATEAAAIGDAAEGPEDTAGKPAGTGNAAGPLVVLGFGLGYAAEAAAEKWPERPLIIVERRRELLLLALETRDLGKLLAGGRLIFVLGDEPAGEKSPRGGGTGPGGGANPDIIIGALRSLEALYGGGGGEAGPDPQPGPYEPGRGVVCRGGTAYQDLGLQGRGKPGNPPPLWKTLGQEPLPKHGGHPGPPGGFPPGGDSGPRGGETGYTGTPRRGGPLPGRHPPPAPRPAGTLPHRGGGHLPQAAPPAGDRPGFRRGG